MWMLERPQLRQVVEQGQRLAPDQGQGLAPQQQRRVPLLPAYLGIGVVLGLVSLALHLLSPSLASDFDGRVLQPFAIAGVVFFGGRALARDKLRWCRSCGRWLAIEPASEKVIRSQPMVRRSQTRLESFNAQGQKVGYSRSQTVTRGVRETVAVIMACQYCGAQRVRKERREK